MPDPVDQPQKPTADAAFNDLRKSVHRTIPAHLKNARTAILHIRAMRRRG